MKKNSGKGLKSSNITSVAYNNKTKLMKVVYHGGNKPDRGYLYPNTELKTYRAISNAKSAGKSVWSNLRRKSVEYKKTKG